MKYSRRKRRLIFFSGVIVLLLPGLVLTWLLYQRYPSEWEPLAETDRCNISGIYSNVGEDADGTPSPLFRLLHNVSAAMPAGDVTKVQITQPDDETLEFSFWRGKEPIEQRVRLQNKRDYHCSSKGVKFTFSETATRVTSCEWKGIWGSYFFSKGADGSLIVHKLGIEAGLLLIVPIVGPDSLWYKFEKADSP
jgi:hypothetical protein